MVQGTLRIPKLSEDCLVQSGDVLIGVLLPLRTPGETGPCDRIGSDELSQPESIRYIIDKINADPDMLPNITLGYVILDVCERSHGSLANALYFLPDEDQLSSHDVEGPCDGVLSPFPVAAVMGLKYSSDCIMMTPVLGLVEIPTFSSTATSDELSDKSRYEYFMRTSAPDRYQTEAMLDLLQMFNWTYFGLVYNEGSYGENGAKFVEKLAGERGLCIALSEMVYTIHGTRDVEQIVQKLTDMEMLRAIVVFALPNTVAELFEVLPEDAYGRFIFIGSDGMSYTDSGTPAEGSFVIHLSPGASPEFDTYSKTLNPWNHPNDIWLKSAWESLYNCTWTCNFSFCSNSQHCSLFENQTLSPMVQANAGFIDIVLTIAKGLDLLFENECPDVYSDQSYINDCLNGSAYLSYLRQVQFHGFSGEIRYNENGYNQAAYVIRQYNAHGEDRKVGFWQQYNGFVSFDTDKVKWSVFNKSPREHGIPHSVCSYPCPTRYYYIQCELPCCWECKQCRSNEIIINGTGCLRCEDNFWPDDEEALVCAAIYPDYINYHHSVAIALSAVNTVAIVLAILITVFLIKYR